MGPELTTILVIEDDTTLALGLQLNLAAEGYRVLTATDGESGLRLALDDKPDLLLLDLMLPLLDGFELLAQLRERGRETPVLVLSARAELDDKLRAFGVGADDYITKPFSVEELTARVRAALRRPARRDEGAAGPPRAIGELTVDLGARRVTRAGQPVELTAREFDLLAYLIAHPERTHSRDHLLAAVWGYDYEGTARTVDNFVRSLRVKLEADPAQPRHLVTVRGIGYRFDLGG